MRRLPLLLTAAFAATSPTPAQTTCPIAVDAIVCDAAGRPLAGVQFGDTWGLQDGRWSPGFLCPNPQHPLDLTSDRDGRIRGTWILSPFGTPLLGLSADRRFAAFVLPAADETTQDLRVPKRIVLQPAVHLRAQLRTSTGAVPASSGALWWPHPQYPGLTTGFGFGIVGATFDLPLPPQRYELRIDCCFGRASPRTAVLTAGSAACDLGPITLQLAAFSLIGEVLPDWHVDRAANIELANTGLADFRGKPLLVYFDEFPDRGRMGGEVRQALAKLAQHPRRAEFQVVLFDTADAMAWPQRQKQPKPVIEQLFPLLADSTHQTEALYGSRWAVVVLDADGRLVHCGAGVDDAVAALARLLGAGPR